MERGTSVEAFEDRANGNVQTAGIAVHKNGTVN